MTTKPALYLIDASIYIFRAWFSLPDNWQASNGYSTSALYGYAGFLLKLLERQRPQAAFVAFDESLGSGFRHQIHPQYKASRALPDEALAFQLNACKTFSQLLGLAVSASGYFEADDLLASAAVKGRDAGYRIHVITRDKDLGQILCSNDDVIQDYPNGEALDARAFADRYGVQPSQLADFLALTGDAIDDVPGVPGIGKVTAQRLLDTFGSLENILGDIQAIGQSDLRGAKRLAHTLHTHREQVAMARKLTGLATNADVPVSGWTPAAIVLDELAAFCADHGLGSAYVKRAEALAENR